jgi:hypothetical protein
MFSKHHIFKLIVAIAVVASVAFAGTHRAMAGRPFITDTLGGNGHALRHAQTPHVVKTAPNLYQNTGSASAALQGYTTSGPGTAKLLAPRSATSPVVTPAAQMALHFQHEDTIYGGRQQITSAPEVSQSIGSPDSDHQQFVTAMQNIRAARVHGFTIDQGFRWLLDPAR